MSCLKELKASLLLPLQDAQVTMECVIAQRFHRSIMGPKGSRIQAITREHCVQIKFPDREDQQGKNPVGLLFALLMFNTTLLW